MKPFYKTFLLLFLNVSFLVFNSFSQQAPGIEWQNTIGGTGNDGLQSIQQTVDGGYILGGYSYSDISGDKTENGIGAGDYWVLKLDGTGNIQWQNTIGGNATDGLSIISQTFDGGYICGGNSYSNISGDKTENGIGNGDWWIVKLDQSGNIQWQNTIGGTISDHLNSISQTSDGGYILGGESTSNISGDKTENSFNNSFDYWVVKLDTAGNIQWQNTIGGSDNDLLYAGISQTSDGGYICGGGSQSNISGDKTENKIGYTDYWVIKLDSAGTIEWQNTIGGTGGDELFSISQTTDGGFICGGFSESDISGDKTENSLGFDYWVIKLDSTGTIQWQNTIGGNDIDFLYSISQCYDGGFICGGLSRSYISGDKSENNMGPLNTSDYWVVRLDSSGNILWQNTIGGTGNDVLLCTVQTKDTGFVCGGFSRSTISADKTEDSLGGNDYWIVKLFPDPTTSISTLQPPSSNFQISPNPTTGIFQITFPSSSNHKTHYTLEIISTLGQTIFSSDLRLPTSDLQTKIDVSFLPKGIYVLKINNGISAQCSKFVIE